MVFYIFISFLYGFLFSIVKKELKQDKADELKAQLEAVGAQVEIV